MKRFLGVLAALALVLPAPNALAAVSSGAIFNDPTVPGKQHAIVDHVRSLITGAAAGSSIRIAIYHFDDPGVAADLVAAHQRGVDVRIVIDYSNADTGPTNTLQAALGNRVTLCTKDAACIGNRG